VLERFFFFKEFSKKCDFFYFKLFLDVFDALMLKINLKK